METQEFHKDLTVLPRPYTQEFREDLTVLPRPYIVSFEELAKKDEAFDRIWKASNGCLDFQDVETNLALTKATLRFDFNLELDIPDDRLCPPVPNRVSYVSWIQRLIDSTASTYTVGYETHRQVVGLDIGTGASAIYALIAMRSRPNWTMCVTDVDKKSFGFAAGNLALNKMLTRVKMLQTSELNALVPLQYLGVEKLDFAMCNPPFFDNEHDMRASLKGEGKSYMPNAVCTGSENEMVYPGGDLGFVTRIVNESLVLREKVSWYTSLFGKLASAKAIIELLKVNGIQNWAVGSVDGGLTKRWLVAWSFGDLRPSNDICRAADMAPQFLPPKTQDVVRLLPSQSPAAAEQIINTKLSALHLIWTWDSKTSSGIGVASKNVWNRKYRRQQRMGRNKYICAKVRAECTKGENGKIALVFRVSVIRNEETKENAVVVDWVRGTDYVLWESFTCYLQRSFKVADESEN